MDSQSFIGSKICPTKDSRKSGISLLHTRKGSLLQNCKGFSGNKLWNISGRAREKTNAMGWKTIIKKGYWEIYPR